MICRNARSLTLLASLLLILQAANPLGAQDHEPDIPLEEVEEESPYGEVTLSVVDSIGERNPKEHDRYLFGGITKSGLHVSPSGRLWVLDRQLDNLRRYTSEGTYIDGHAFRRGRGPGEMQDPTALVVDDRSGTIYIGDTDGRRATVFDTSMSVQETFTINHGYFDLYPWSEGGGVLAIPWRRNVPVDSPAVHVYGRNGERMSSFAYINYHTRANIEAGLKNGGYETYLVETSEYYVIAISYPYEILVFEKTSRDLARRFTRSMDIYGEIIDGGDERVELLVPGGHSAGLVAVNDHLILHFIRDNVHDETIIHAFDEQGRTRGTMTWSDISSAVLDGNIAIADGPENIFYVEASKPYLRLLKVEVRPRQE